MKSQCRAVSYLTRFMGLFLPFVEIHFTLNRYQKYLHCHTRLLFSVMERRHSVHQLKSLVTIDRKMETKCLLRAPSVPTAFQKRCQTRVVCCPLVSCGTGSPPPRWQRRSTLPTPEWQKPQPASPKAWGPVQPELRRNAAFQIEIDISNVL